MNGDDTRTHNPVSVQHGGRWDTDPMIYWFGDLLDRLNGRRYKTGRGFPRPTLMDVMQAYEKEMHPEKVSDDIRDEKDVLPLSKNVQT